MTWLRRNDPSDDHLGGAPRRAPSWRSLGSRALTAGLVLLIVATIAGILILSGCADQPAPPRVPAADQAADLRAREADHRQQAAAVATSDPTAAALHQRLAVELAQLATEAEARAQTQQADLDRRTAEAAAQSEARQWRTITRWLGLGAIVAAGLVGGLLSWLAGPRLGVPVALILAGTGLLTVGYGATIRWVPVTVLLAVLIAGGVWLWAHLRDRRATRTLDAAGRTAAREWSRYAEHLGNLDHLSLIHI
jgi:hypothetical protein